MKADREDQREKRQAKGCAARGIISKSPFMEPAAVVVTGMNKSGGYELKMTHGSAAAALKCHTRDGIQSY